MASEKGTEGSGRKLSSSFIERATSLFGKKSEPTLEGPAADASVQSADKKPDYRRQISWGKARSLKMVITGAEGKIPLENKVHPCCTGPPHVPGMT